MTVESTQKIDIKIPIGNYKVIPVDKLESYIVREIREENVEKIKQSIIEKGYNPSRVLTVVKNGETFFVAAGNHRLQAIKELGMSAVPCLVISGDIYSIAIKDNLDENTFAPLDLFDWLDIIKRLRNEGLTQKEIGEKIGFSREKVSYYYRILDVIVTQVLNFCKQHQEGRVTKNVTNVTFDFTEGWFRYSGLYDLNEKYQLDCIKRFITDKFNWTNQKLQKETAKYKQWQDFTVIARDKLVDNTNLEKIISLIENDTFKTEGQLLSKISDLNNKSKNKLICGDAVEELANLEDSSIDLVITDAPYGKSNTNNSSKYFDHITTEPVLNNTLNESIDLLEKVCEILSTKTKANSHLYFFTHWNVYSTFERIISNFFTIKSVIVWDKGNHSAGDLEYSWANRHELIIFATKGSRPLNKRKDDILNIPRIASTKLIHPTQKPVEVIKELLEVSLQPGDIVCDCFMGSGSTIKALKEFSSDCNYIGIELSREIFEKAKAFIGGTTN